MKYLLIVVALLLAVLRFRMPAHPLSLAGSYEAAAHLFVGGLIGAAVASKRWRLFCAVLAGLLSAVELVAFLALPH